MKLLYFAWVRERIGTDNETRDIPADVTTAGALKAWLAGIDEGYAYAFEDQAIIRVALDKLVDGARRGARWCPRRRRFSAYDGAAERHGTQCEDQGSG